MASDPESSSTGCGSRVLFGLQPRWLAFTRLRLEVDTVESWCKQISESDRKHSAWESIAGWSTVRKAITFTPGRVMSLARSGSLLSPHKLLDLPTSIRQDIRGQETASVRALRMNYEGLARVLQRYATSGLRFEGEEREATGPAKGKLQEQDRARKQKQQQRHASIQAAEQKDGNYQLPAVRDPPSPMVLYWPHLTFGLVTAQVLLRVWKGFDLQRTVREFVQGVIETSYRYLRHRVWKPLFQMYNTIRYDERELSLQRRSSLEADLTSLKRMVQAFAQDALGYEEDELDALTLNVDNGDITPVLMSYEHDMQRPINSALFGNIIRATLIQVQKAKVDLQLAVSAVDKLLQSNELNFQMMAVIPAVWLAWMLLKRGFAFFKRLIVHASVTSSGTARDLVRRLKRLVAATANNPSLEAEGRIAYLAIASATQVAALTFMTAARKRTLFRDLEHIIFAGLPLLHHKDNGLRAAGAQPLLVLHTRLALIDSLLHDLK